MLNTYVKIEKFDEDGNNLVTFVEPLDLDSIIITLETELVDEGNIGEKVVLTLIEMTEKEYEDIAEINGY